MNWDPSGASLIVYLLKGWPSSSLDNLALTGITGTRGSHTVYHHYALRCSGQQSQPCCQLPLFFPQSATTIKMSVKLFTETSNGIRAAP